MRNLLTLESFDRQSQDDPGPGYDEGYAAGFAAATQAAAIKSDRLNDQLVQYLTDSAFTYREARQDVLSSLDALVTALSDTILPQSMAQGFAQRITELALSYLGPDDSKVITLHVHPDQVASVQRATQGIEAIMTIRGDPALTPHAAWIGQPKGEIYLDMDQHLSDISDLLSNITDANKGIEENG